MQMFFRTDLALELKEGGQPQLADVPCSTQEKDRCKISRITVPCTLEDTGMAPGEYITIEMPSLSDLLDEDDRCLQVVAQELRALLPQNGLVLVAGLGNAAITPDALGQKVIGQILATRHIKQELERITGIDELRSVAAVCTDVLGNTGVETAELLQSLARRLAPAAVIVIDAMAARSLARLGKTVQISTGGIAPGAGVGNHRPKIDRALLGVPVISVGVPTVVDAATAAVDLLGGEQAAPEEKERLRQLVSPGGAAMFVTPREIDLLIQRGARMIGMAINAALNPCFTVDDFELLTK